MTTPRKVPETARPLQCPRCTGFDIFKHGSILSSRGRVQRYECRTCHKKFHPSLKMVPLVEREGFLDIECSQLKSSFGHIYCGCLKERGDPKIQVFQLKQRTLRSEGAMLRDLVQALRKFDRIYTYYGTRFDIPFMRTRCLYHGIEFPEYMQLYHTDLYFVARNRLATLHSKRLEAVCKFLGIEGKTPLDSEVWVKACFNDTFDEAMRYIIEHNKGDVVILEKLLDRIEPFFRGTNRSV